MTMSNMLHNPSYLCLLTRRRPRLFSFSNHYEASPNRASNHELILDSGWVPTQHELFGTLPASHPPNYRVEVGVSYTFKNIGAKNESPVITRFINYYSAESIKWRGFLWCRIPTKFVILSSPLHFERQSGLAIVKSLLHVINYIENYMTLLYIINLICIRGIGRNQLRQTIDSFTATWVIYSLKPVSPVSEVAPMPRTPGWAFRIFVYSDTSRIRFSDLIEYSATILGIRIEY